MKLQHIAYYNDNIDLLFFSEQTADAIVDCAKKNYGGLHSIDSFDATTHTKEEFEEGVLRFTTDGKYAVAMDLPIDLSVLKNPNVCDFFIDIYEVIEEEEEDVEEDVSPKISDLLKNNTRISICIEKVSATDGIITIYNPSTREVYREMDVSGKHDAIKNIILMLETML